MPFMEQGNLYEAVDITNHYYSMPESVRQTSAAAYICPSHRGADALSTQGDARGTPHLPGALASYAACNGDGSLTYRGGNGAAVPTFVCSDPPVHETCYMNGVLSGAMYTGWKPQRKFSQIRDGLSNTLFAGEKHILAGHEGELVYGDNSYFNDDGVGTALRFASENHPLASSPTSLAIGPAVIPGMFPEGEFFGSRHSGGIVQFVLCDGSVQSLSPDIDAAVLGLLAKISDGEPIPSF